MEESAKARGQPTAVADHLAVAEEGTVGRTAAEEEGHHRPAAAAVEVRTEKLAAGRGAARSLGDSFEETGQAGRDGVDVEVVLGRATAVDVGDSHLGLAAGVEQEDTGPGAEEHMAELGVEVAVEGSRMVSEYCTQVFHLTEGCDHLCLLGQHGHHDHLHSGKGGTVGSQSRERAEAREVEVRNCRPC